METVWQLSRAREVHRRSLFGVAALLLALGSGCQHYLARLCPFVAEQPDAPPTGAVCKIVATWNHQVVYTPDPANAGAPTPGLAGRVYLFDQNISFPLAGDGTLVVDLYDGRLDANGGKPVLLEQWRFDPATLARLLRKDTIGWGYTVFLPWGTYKPELNRVVLKLCYQPAQGSPIYADSAVMTLQGDRPSRGPTTAALPSATR